MKFRYGGVIEETSGVATLRRVAKCFVVAFANRSNGAIGKALIAFALILVGPLANAQIVSVSAATLEAKKPNAAPRKPPGGTAVRLMSSDPRCVVVDGRNGGGDFDCFVGDEPGNYGDTFYYDNLYELNYLTGTLDRVTVVGDRYGILTALCLGGHCGTVATPEDALLGLREGGYLGHNYKPAPPKKTPAECQRADESRKSVSDMLINNSMQACITKPTYAEIGISVIADVTRGGGKLVAILLKPVMDYEVKECLEKRAEEGLARKDEDTKKYNACMLET